MSKSEVARTREQIEQEIIALTQVMSDMRCTASHKIIHHQYNQLDGYREALAELIGSEEAMQVTLAIYSNVLD